jgi:hypothetical protein
LELLGVEGLLQLLCRVGPGLVLDVGVLRVLQVGLQNTQVQRLAGSTGGSLPGSPKSCSDVPFKQA